MQNKSRPVPCTFHLMLQKSIFKISGDATIVVAIVVIIAVALEYIRDEFPLVRCTSETSSIYFFYTVYIFFVACPVERARRQLMVRTLPVRKTKKETVVRGIGLFYFTVSQNCFFGGCPVSESVVWLR